MGKLQLPPNLTLCEFWHPGRPDHLVASLELASAEAIPDISAIDPQTLPKPVYSLIPSQSPSPQSPPENLIDIRFQSRIQRRQRACFIIGRRRGAADVSIDHKSLSRAHAALFYDGSCRLHLQDLGSKNGTFLDAQRLPPNQPQPLLPGALLRFGNYPFCFRVAAMAEPAEDSSPALSAPAQKNIKSAKSAGNAQRLEISKDSKISKSLQSFERSESSTKKKNVDVDVNVDFPVVAHETFSDVHSKAVCALAVNGSGSRFATGSYDYTVRLWDFGGMTRELRPFKELIPEEGHIVSSLSFSPTGAYFLATPESAKARVFTREGQEELVTTRGDPYLHDQARTKGHVSTITCGRWSPVEKRLFLTCGVDGTCRIWDVKGRRTMLDNELICRNVLKAKDRRNARIKVTACAFSHDGARIACACTDGSLQMWNPTTGAQYGTPDIIIRPAHAEGSDTSCVAFDPSSSYLVSRGGDDSLLLWDVRKPKGPVKKLFHITSLDNTWPQCNAVFSPDGRYVLTGTSTKRGGPGTGDLCFWKVGDSSTTPALRMPVCQGASVIGVDWHAKLNQIFVTGEEGLVRVYYDPEKSSKGVLQALGRTTSRKRDYVANVDPTHVYEGDIYVPNALPMFRDAQERMFIRKKYKQTVKDQQRKDPVLSKRPELPPAQIQANINQEINQMNVANAYNEGVTKPRAPVLQQDPREELLKYDVAGREQGGATWVEGSYKESQPTKVLAEKTMEEDEEMIEKARTSLKEYQEQSTADK